MFKYCQNNNNVLCCLQETMSRGIQATTEIPYHHSEIKYQQEQLFFFRNGVFNV